MAPMNDLSNNKPRPQRGTAPGPKWQVGEIAFLKPASDFTVTEQIELLETGRVRDNATGHPVIILGRSDDSRYFLVTTVSAYGSGIDNDYLPPWEQRVHSHKDVRSFRSFEGSAKPDDKFPHLRLADNKMWPKPKTSWVYIQTPTLVSASVLIYYTKSRCRLRMAPESLHDLLGHMEAKSHLYRKLKAEISGVADPLARKCTDKSCGWGKKEQVSRAKISGRKYTNNINRNRREVPRGTTSGAPKSRTEVTSGRPNLSNLSKVAGWSHGNRFATLS
ncbi:hypothetical protein GGR51DRAFT_574207 [Nemania sp. FL0031]|nr:hypothetical protein GGR51DRAFT_574207 [Nemania sp. FL0031]